MPQILSNLVDVYPYRFVAARREYLLLRRAPDVLYAGDWRMVGGKIEDGELAWQAAARELIEETGCTAKMLWTIPSANIFYEWRSDAVRIVPAFAAEIEGEPDLNHEHDDFGWFGYAAAAQRLRWPEQRRLVGIVDAELDREIPVSWRVN